MLTQEAPISRYDLFHSGTLGRGVRIPFPSVTNMLLQMGVPVQVGVPARFRSPRRKPITRPPKLRYYPHSNRVVSWWPFWN